MDGVELAGVEDKGKVQAHAMKLIDRDRGLNMGESGKWWENSRTNEQRMGVESAERRNRVLRS